MNEKTNCVIQTAGGYEGFNQLVERGRQMHNQAVFELSARIVSNSVLLLKRCYGLAVGTQESRSQRAGRSIHRAQRNPVQAVAEM